MANSTTANKNSISELFQKYWDQQLSISPSYATFCGVNDYNDRLEDLSIENWKSHLSWLSDLREEILDFPEEKLDAEDKISRKILLDNIDFAHRLESYPTHYLAINQMTGPHLSFYQIAKVHPFRSRQDLQDLISRIKAHAVQLRQVMDHLKEGAENNWVLPLRVVDLVIGQFENLNNEEVVAERLRNFITDQNQTIIEEHADLWESIRHQVRESLIQSYAQMIDFLSNDYRALARETFGLCGLPEGKDLYQEYIRNHTTLQDLSADAIHYLGMQEIERIHSEMSQIQVALGVEGDLQDLFESFRSNSELHYSSREEIVEHHRALLVTMDAKLSDYFESLPKNKYEVHPLPSYQEKESPDAFYMPGNLASDRPGVYYVNTYGPETRGKYNAEVLAYHEAVPGHHLQISIAQELENLPTFRKYSSETAYVEGWALYTEKLSEEMGFYQTLESKFGRLSFELWRAARLVVDTGLHAFGWSRQKAIDFLQINTGLSLSNIEVEVDRYIVMPGQALSYKIGERFMLDLRNMVYEYQGDDFDIKEFHRVILEHGAVPLPILGDLVRSHYKMNEQSAP